MTELDRLEQEEAALEALIAHRKAERDRALERAVVLDSDGEEHDEEYEPLQ